MSILSERLKQARRNQKLRQVDVAGLLGVNKLSISNYERGTRTPDINTLQKLADIYHVSTDWLVGSVSISNIEGRSRAAIDYYSKIPNAQVPGRILHKKGIFEVPVLKKLDNLASVYEKSNIKGFIHIELDRLDLNIRDEIYFWQVDSANMSPTILLGDFVLIRKQSSVKSGETGVFIFGNLPSVNVLYHMHGYSIITSTNPEFPARKEKASAVISVGKVILLQRYFGNIGYV